MVCGWSCRVRFLRSGAFWLHTFIIDPEQRSGKDAHRSHTPPDPLGLMHNLSEMMEQRSAKPSADQRPDSDGQKRKSHIGALLSRRGEPGNIFVVARLLDDLAEGKQKQRKNHAHAVIKVPKITA